MPSFANVLHYLIGAGSPFLSGAASLAGALGANSLFNFISNRFNPQQKLIDYNSPEFRRLLELNRNQTMSNQSASNPYMQSPSVYNRISDDTVASMYMQAQQMNAPYSGNLQASLLLAQQMGLGQQRLFGAAQSSAQQLGNSFIRQLFPELGKRPSPTKAASYFGRSPMPTYSLQRPLA